MDFYNSVFPVEAKMCVAFMSFRAPPAAQKQKNLHNSTNMQPIKTYFHETSHFDCLFEIIEHVIGMLHFSCFFIFNKFPATYAFHMGVEYDKTK